MIRSYQDSDYPQLKELYLQPEYYGGEFSESRDGRERLASKIQADPEAILVYESEGKILGTISIIEDGRVAWLYRFVVSGFDPEVTRDLYDAAVSILKERGHSEVLVYTDGESEKLNDRYQRLGMNEGGNYKCYWKAL